MISPLVGAGLGSHRNLLLSERMPAKLAMFMAVSTVLACEMTFRTGLATLQGSVFSARVTSSLRHIFFLSGFGVKSAR